jgi:glyoxylase-like metal-dependent hydrolase (beta-lactamase superfamily II)
MRRLLTVAFSAAVSVGVFATGRSQTVHAPVDPARFDVQKLADGVYAAIRTEPAGLLLDANSVFIVNDQDVTVVDTNVTPSSARATLAALRKITAKPVSHIINTHWHDDHIIGNQVYREAFPNAQIIGQATTTDDLPTIGAANRKLLIDRGPQMVMQLRISVDQQKSMTGGLLTDEERVSYLSDVDAAERYFAEVPAFQIVLPTIVVTDHLTLTRGSRNIDVLFLGRGHTGADLVVHLPSEKILIAGDLVVSPVPLIGSTSYPLELGATLDRLLALKPALIVPGHGPVLRDESYVRQEVRLLASLKQQVEAAVARGDSLEDTRKSVDLEAMRKVFAGDSQMKSFVFNNYVTMSGVAAAYRDAVSKR